MTAPFHASCAARGPAGVLILGRSGAGKSTLLLRLLRHGFDLVADDQVVLDGLGNEVEARAPERLRGLLEVRGLGVYRLPFRPVATVRLVVEAGVPADRVALPRVFSPAAAPAIVLDLLAPASPDVVAFALSCLEGAAEEVAGPLGAVAPLAAPWSGTRA